MGDENANCFLIRLGKTGPMWATEATSDYANNSSLLNILSRLILPQLSTVAVRALYLLPPPSFKHSLSVMMASTEANIVLHQVPVLLPLPPSSLPHSHAAETHTETR